MEIWRKSKEEDLPMPIGNDSYLTESRKEGVAWETREGLDVSEHGHGLAEVGMKRGLLCMVWVTQRRVCLAIGGGITSKPFNLSPN